MPDWLRAYHNLPYPLQVLAASLRGSRFQAARYPSTTDLAVQRTLSREGWTVGQWREWQQERLTRLLWHAARNVPYYSRQWEERRRKGDRSSVESLANWPVLSKDALRDNPKAFLTNGINNRGQIVEHTSGTTGKPLTLWFSPSAVSEWYSLVEARWRAWYGLSRHDRWGILGGQMVAPFSKQSPPFWVWNSGMHQLYLSSYHLAPQNIPAYIDSINRHRLVYLLGYASSLYSLARFALEQNLRIPSLKAVISNAEPLYAHQREMISRTFQCPVYDTYGQSEQVCAASECLRGNLHLWPEVGVTEILDDDRDVALAPGGTGRLVCTGFLNFSMPLIRYAVGDRGSLSEETACACGRRLPVLGGIEGRQDDVIIARDGRRIGRLDPVFKSDLPIHEAQIIQETLDYIRVLLVPAPGFSRDDELRVVERLRERLGNMGFRVELVGQVPRSSNGKFRAVISNLD